MVVGELKKAIETALAELNFSPLNFDLKHPAKLVNGDYASNVALVLAKKIGQNPKALAARIAAQVKHPAVEKVTVAGLGFVNFYLRPDFFVAEIKKILSAKDRYGQSDHVAGYRTIVEYTDPNPFKLFHLGHLMSNAIGESISRIIEANGAAVKRACYQGDVGNHVAKAIYGLKAGQSLFEAYAYGSTAEENDESAGREINELNKKIYDRSDEEINRLYDDGRRESLAEFEKIYQKLGTKFDFYFFESETGPVGKEIVLANPTVFEKSERAWIYRGEQDGLHTRVFINADGLPTYEAKELGLAKIKSDRSTYDLSIVVTGNEIKEYFKVLLAALKKIFPDLAEKIRHVPHGMLRLPSGKMSSRTGAVITAEQLITEIKNKIKNKLAKAEKGKVLSETTLEQVAVGAIKYSILRQDSAKDIIFDLDRSISFEGSSGPYLQYTFARTQSVLAKAESEQIAAELKVTEPPGEIEKLIYRFPEIVAQAGEELAPHHLTTYLTELASAFNSYYTNNKIVNAEPVASFRVALTAVVGQVLKNGLYLLGIEAPVKM